MQQAITPRANKRAQEKSAKKSARAALLPAATQPTAPAAGDDKAAKTYENATKLPPIV